MKTDSNLHVIYVSRLCSAEAYNTLFCLSGKRLMLPAQKHHKLMAEGLAAHRGVHVTAIGAIPVSRQITKKIFFKGSTSEENGIVYRMITLLNIPLLRQLAILLGTMNMLWKESGGQDSQKIVVCDVLCSTMSFAALAISWLRKIKTIGYVTDVPLCLYNESSVLSAALTRALINRYKAYLFLNVHMNEIINPRNRPYVVAEALADPRMAERENSLQAKSGERICLYAGGLGPPTGIQMLTEAFLEADISGAVLQVFGMDGYENTLIELSRQHKNIRFGGVVLNEQIVEEQIKATLLINPRPTNQDLAKFSFPSKLVEYIASGTPVLTTKIPGMPEEYLPYVYLFEEETVEGYAKTLREVLSLPAGQLHAKGMAAKEFAMKYKTNIVQADKLLQMSRGIL